MKKFDRIMSGQLDNDSSSVKSCVSDDDDEPDLQKILSEESRQRRLNRKRLIQLKQAQQRYKRKTKKVSVTALFKQIIHDCQVSINDVVVIDLVNQMATVVCISYAFISIFLISSSCNKVQPFKFHIVGLSNPQTILENGENNKIGSTKLSKDKLS